MLSSPAFPRVALLIDADNALPKKHLEQILKICGYYGELKKCHAYGDWEKLPLSASRARVEGLNIEPVQVDRDTKQATDKQLKSEARKILREDDADLFVIASGDGDFISLCEQIRQTGRKVAGIGNKVQSSIQLQTACDAFYYIEDLDKILGQPDEETRLLEFTALLFRALHSMPYDKEGWVNRAALGIKLRELDPGFKNRFGGKKQSKWLSDLSSHLEINGQMVRVIDP